MGPVLLYGNSAPTHFCCWTAVLDSALLALPPPVACLFLSASLRHTR